MYHARHFCSKPRRYSAGWPTDITTKLLNLAAWSIASFQPTTAPQSWPTRCAGSRTSSASSKAMMSSASVSRRYAPTPSGTSLRSEEHTSELQSLIRISYAVFCLKNKKKDQHHTNGHSANAEKPTNKHAL